MNAEKTTIGIFRPPAKNARRDRYPDSGLRRGHDDSAALSRPRPVGLCIVRRDDSSDREWCVGGANSPSGLDSGEDAAHHLHVRQGSDEDALPEAKTRILSAAPLLCR